MTKIQKNSGVELVNNIYNIIDNYLNYLFITNT